MGNGSAVRDIGISPDGSRVYVGIQDEMSLRVIDTTLGPVVSGLRVGSLIDTVPLGIPCCFGGGEVNSDGSTVYVGTNSDQSEPVAVDTATDQVTNITGIPAQGRPLFLAISGDGNTLVTANLSANTVSVVDASANPIFSIVGSPIAVGTTPVGIALIGSTPAAAPEPTNQAPTCSDININIAEDGDVTSHDLTGQCTDPDTGDTIDIEIVALDLVSVDPVNVGSLPLVLDSIDLEPDLNFNGDGGSFTFRADDGNGGVSPDATGNVTVTPVNDPPTLSLPANIAGVEATGPDGATVSYSATADDIEDGTLTPTCNPSSGSIFGLGATTVNCSVTDSGSTPANGSFTVEVVDTTRPDLTDPANIVEEGNTTNGANATLPASTATDIVDPAPALSCDQVSGFFPLGETTVTCIGADASDNESEGSYTVTVTDNTPPELTLPDTDGRATGEEGGTVDFDVTVTDIVDPDPTIVCDPASGSTFAVGVHTVNCTATDGSDNSSSGSVPVVLVDDCECTKSQGFWKKQYSGKEKGNQIDDSKLEGFLDIVNLKSGLFDEGVALSSIADANLILDPKKNRDKGNRGARSKEGTTRDPRSKSKGKKKGKKDRGGDDSNSSGDSDRDSAANKLEKKREQALTQTLAAWLNYAKGGILLDEAVTVSDDTRTGSSRRGGAAPAPENLIFEELIAEVELILGNENATLEELQRTKTLAEAVNQHDKDNPACVTKTGSRGGSRTGSSSSR